MTVAWHLTVRATAFTDTCTVVGCTWFPGPTVRGQSERLGTMGGKAPAATILVTYSAFATIVGVDGARHTMARFSTPWGTGPPWPGRLPVPTLGPGMPPRRRSCCRRRPRSPPRWAEDVAVQYRLEFGGDLHSRDRPAAGIGYRDHPQHLRAAGAVRHPMAVDQGQDRNLRHPRNVTIDHEPAASAFPSRTTAPATAGAEPPMSDDHCQQVLRLLVAQNSHRAVTQPLAC